jgi:proline iminopeptidase
MDEVAPYPHGPGGRIMDFTRRGAVSALGAVGLAGIRKAEVAPEGRVAVPGGTIWYRIVGAEKPGTPLLTLHGGPGAGHDYLLPMAALADQRPVVFFDQLGCGKADNPADDNVYTIQRSVDEVDAVRRALGLSKIHLFGNSWGSMLAIEYLCQGRGAGVEKLVLSGALASVPQASAGMQRLIDALPGGKGRRLHELEASGQQASPEYMEIVNLFYARHLCRADPPPPEIVKTIETLSRSNAYRVLNGPNEFTIVGKIKDWDRRADLGRIKNPTLLTTGEYDEVTLDCHETIKAGVAGSQLVVMEDCSHLTMNEKPAEYVKLLRDFLA